MSKEDSPVSGRSGIMRLLGSTRVTPILGLAALISILYFKSGGKDEKKKKKPLSSQVDKSIPVFAPKGILGRTREAGPLLTRAFFRSGELIIRRGKEKHLVWGIIEKQPKQVWLLSKDKRVPLMDWLKQGDGRFALYRTRLPKGTWKTRRAAVQKALSQQAALASIDALIKLVQESKGTLPARSKSATAQTWLQSVIQTSHYNDLDPT